MELNPAHHTYLIKTEAARLGFSFCGISKAGFLEEEAPRLEQWLKQGHHGKMGYMENHFDMRLDPVKLVPGAKSVISLLLNYYPEKEQNPEAGYKISRYAYGKDYHKVIKKKLKDLYQFINTEIGDVGGRVFVDSAPVMDKAWAKKSGLGWMGKNTNIINKGSGSYYFIAEMILDLELEYDHATKDYCGSCTRCIDACPTDALIAPYQIDAGRCISYLTIELRESIPAEFQDKMQNWIFGCDICQEVCPWNRFSKPTQVIEFSEAHSLLEIKKQEWDEITEEVFGRLFEGSAVKRTKFEGLKRNITFAARQNDSNE